MTKTWRVRGRLVAVASVAIVGAMFVGCSSTKSARVVDAGRGAGGGTSGSGGIGAGGSGTGGVLGGTDGGTAAGGVGGRATAGVGGGGAGGLGAGGTGAGGTGMADAPTCVGMACPEPDASASDVPMSMDSGSGGVGSGGRTSATGGAGSGGVGSGGVGSGGVGSGGRTGATGGTGSGGTGVGGVTGSGGSGGTGGTACRRVPSDDAVCRSQNYPPLAYFCAVPARPPSTACVLYNGIDSGDYDCCPDQYVSCPDQPPTNAAACITSGLTCTYGSHPEPRCRTSATCQNGAWQVHIAACAPPSLPGGCPTTPTPGGGGACSPFGLGCDYPTGDYCECTSGCNIEYPSCPITPPPDAWYCWAPPSLPAGCPTFYPNLGSVCALPANTDCRYRCDVVALCSADGVWVPGPNRCPKCNAPDTPIATPDGNRPIASLVPGDLVYSIHRGQIVIVPIAETGRQAAQRDHRVVRLLLATGTVLEISPRHPTADGRTLGELAANDQLDGVRIISAALVPFRHSHTYDILPASDTGTYYAGGVLIGSTMAPSHRLASVPVPACTIR